MPCQVYTHRNFILDGHGQQRWRVDLKIRQRSRNCSRDMDLVPLLLYLEGNLFVLDRLARKLDLEIGVNRRRRGIRFRQASAHRDQRKLRAARNLKHVKISIGVSGIKRFDWHSNQEIALPCMTDALALSRMTHALRLMEWMRYVVRKRALLKHPLAVGRREGGQRRE